MGLSRTREAVPTALGRLGHLQCEETAVGSLSGLHFRIPLGRVMLVGEEGEEEEGRGVAREKVNGKFGGCQVSGREWRERRRRVRTLLGEMGEGREEEEGEEKCVYMDVHVDHSCALTFVCSALLSAMADCLIPPHLPQSG